MATLNDLLYVLEAGFLTLSFCFGVIAGLLS